MPSTTPLPATAIVTGGARRIGAAIVRALAEDGWHVLIHCQDSREEAEALVADIGNARVVTADLADPAAPVSIIGAASEMPPLRLLVNNASRFVHDDVGGFDAADWDAHMAVNARAPVLLARDFANRSAGKGALIVNLLDAKLSAPNPDFFSYTLSKMALADATELLARALAPQGIRVCAIAPAVTLRSGEQSEANFQAVHKLNPLRQGVEPGHIVAALRYLIASPTLTGQTITIDAGQRFLGLSRDVQFLEGKS